MKQRFRNVLFIALVCLSFPSACAPKTGKQQVVVYTSVDQVYAEPVFQAFEKQTGITVLPVYDVEATKTVGLVQRLLAEKSNPRADVFWNNEFSQTLLLKDQGLLQPYQSPSAAELPTTYRDPEANWTAFGGRARVILINTNRVSKGDEPDSVASLVSPHDSADQAGMANPLFGTTLTHAAALYAALGPEAGKQLFEEIAKSGVKIVDGNSVVRDMVVSGQLAWGLTDTDDACGAIQKGGPLKVVFPDQGSGQPGTLLIPNTVALISGGPHPSQGKAFIDYLLTPQVEADLVKAGSIQIPARPLPAGVDLPCFAGMPARMMDVGFEQIYRSLEPAQADLRDLFMQ